jgi:hypothetical protein
MASRENDQEATSTTAAVKEKGQQLANEAQQQVQQKTEEVRVQAADRLREQVERQSTSAGEQAHSLGKALRQSSEQLRAEGKGAPATVVGQAADRAESLGRYLRESTADQIIHDVESFARRRPWLTGAAGVLAGFMASRFVKASSQRRYQTSGYRGYETSPSHRRELVAGGAR